MDTLLMLASIGLLISFICKIWFDGSIFFALHDKLSQIVYEISDGKISVDNEGVAITKPVFIYNPITWHRFLLRGFLCKLCLTTQMSVLSLLVVEPVSLFENIILGHAASVGIVFVVAYATLIKLLEEEE